MNFTDNHSDQISRYLNGEMNSAEQIAFEREIANDEFLADAIAGYKQSGAMPSDLEQIKSKIIKPKSKSRILLGMVYTGIAASILIGLLYLIFRPVKNDPTNQKTEHQIVDVIIAGDSVVKNDTLQIIEDLPLKTNTYIAEIRTKPEKLNIPESISPLYLNKTLTIDNTINESNINNYYHYKSNHLYSYIGNFKIVDYRFEKRINIKQYQIPSNFREETDQNSLLAKLNNNITYINYLDQALDKIERNNFLSAMYDFDIILDQFPEDANAVFYKAVCLQKMNNNQAALKYFDLALSLRINTFHEESKWHKSQILKEERQYAAAEKILKEIITENGYYGVHAKKDLDELYKWEMRIDE